MNVIRLRTPLFVALGASIVLSSCATFSNDAARVDGQSLSKSDLDEEVTSEVDDLIPLQDQINLTDEDSRIMPVAGGGFDQCYNAQAVVAAGSLLVIEGVRQMRGTATSQVKGARHCIVSNQGGTMQTHGTLILGNPQ